jgi:nucleotide-binding universal stress UspA family protein
MRTRVIVPVDESSQARRALPVAGWLAQRRGAELVLVRVVEDPTRAVEADVDLEEILLETELTGRTVVSDGPDIPDDVVAEARRSPGSLICLATHRGRLRAAAPTATTSRLLQRAPCPLVLVGPACVLDTEPPKAIVACVDGTELSERVLPLVDDLAASLELDVWLAQVVAPGPAPAPLDVEESAYLGRLGRTMARPVTNWDVLHGDDPAKVILEHCATHPGSLPALATHGRTGAQLVLHGSVALRVAHRARTPVVVIPPGA